MEVVGMVDPNGQDTMCDEGGVGRGDGPWE
jgi:hypothetical protein